MGYLKIPDDPMISLDEALHLKDKEVVLMCTGAQGEPSSIIGRLSAGTNRQFDIEPGDTVVLSSHPIPGNEEAVNKTINRLFRLGAEVVYEAVSPVHVSGHASSEEQKLLLNLVRPKFFIPIHGELHHLKQHAVLATQVGIPDENIAVVENGPVLELLDGKLHLGERLPGGYIFVEGESVGEIDLDVMREREQLARSGILLIIIPIDKFSNRLITKAEVITRGFISSEDISELIPAIQNRIESMINTSSTYNEKQVSNNIRNMLYNETGRKPMVFVVISKT